METPKEEIKIRPMTPDDLNAVSSIDQETRNKGEAYTYLDVATKLIVTTEKQVNHTETPVSHVDCFKVVVSELLDLGFVAEIEGQVRAFILGRIVNAREGDAEGTTAILGVHPDYRQRGIASLLYNKLCGKFRSENIKTIRVAHKNVDQRDKPLLDFIESVSSCN